MPRIVTYGHGGHRPGEPDNNIIEDVDIPDAPEVVVEQSLTAEAPAALDGLRLIANSTGTLTAAQLSNACRLMARVLIVLVRLAMRLFDSNT